MGGVAPTKTSFSGSILILLFLYLYHVSQRHKLSLQMSVSIYDKSRLKGFQKLWHTIFLFFLFFFKETFSQICLIDRMVSWWQPGLLLLPFWREGLQQDYTGFQSDKNDLAQETFIQLCYISAATIKICKTDNRLKYKNSQLNKINNTEQNCNMRWSIHMQGAAGKHNSM